MKKLAIIGASYLQLPLVKKANAMGIETHCFAWADGAICKDFANYFYPLSVLDKERILEECQKINIDGIITIATDMAVPTISYVAEKMNLTGNSYKTAIEATDKWEMREAFNKSNCAIPNYKVADSINTVLGDFNYPIIVKPVDRSGSRGVTKVDSEAELQAAIQKGIDESLSKKAIIEEFIEGDEVSVESISWNGEHYILAITDKVTTGAPNFVELAHHQPSTLPVAILKRIKDETVKALSALNIKYGASHTEIKINAKGDVFLIEVGARMGGDFIGSHLVALSTGYDFIKGVIEVALGEFTIPEISEKQYAGIYFLCKETERLLPYFETPNAFDVEKEIQNREFRNISNSNDRSGYLIYQSSKKEALL